MARVAAALSDPLRLQILSILAKGRDESCTSTPHPELPEALCPYIDVQPKLGNIATSKLSYHLKELRDAGLLEERRLGKQVFYLIKQETLKRFLERVQKTFLTPSTS
ncbi:transcriptional regulator [Ktedonospora formicarum]|uniref:Transcriptional regulator n=1 Tax=Ktedonospora formicarum TaxID=2778364 RepID=A0A8J3I519_9CHLR|nr:transcriptional regulator [Ktedonospora formicarum]